MGKATRWLRSLLGNRASQPESSSVKEKKTNRKWSLAKSADDSAQRSVKGAQFKNVVHDPSAIPYVEAVDANKHAIAVAAATAAVAEAALAAAHAAAEVVRLTTGCVGEYVNIDRRRMIAAV